MPDPFVDLQKNLDSFSTDAEEREQFEYLGIYPDDFEFRTNYNRNNLTPMEALVLTVFGEARGTGDKDQRFVTHVILNRLADGYRGAKTIHDVVFEKYHFSTWNQSQDNAANYGNMLEPKQQVLRDVYDIVFEVLKRRTQGLNPIPGIYHFMSTNALSFTTENGRQIVTRVSPAYDDWAIGQEAVYIGDMTFIRFT